MTMNKWKLRALSIGLGGLIGVSATMIWTFFMAYANGGRIIVDINIFNEAKIEFVILIILIPLMIYTVTYTNKKIAEEDVK